MKIAMSILIIAFIVIALLFCERDDQTEVVRITETDQVDTTLPVTLVVGGETVTSARYPSVWKFKDPKASNRDCYFTSSGGIWCD